MVSDTNFSDGDTRGQMRKVWRVHGKLVGLAGNLEEMAPFLLWIKHGMVAPHPKVPNMSALMLDETTLLHFAGSTAPVVVQGWYEAIGTGAAAAKAAHQALEYADPRRAVKIACNHDHGSRTPVRLYRVSVLH